MISTNLEMLQAVAHGLGELKNEMVFIGGVVAELYASNPAASVIRPTLDVDCVIVGTKRVFNSELPEHFLMKRKYLFFDQNTIWQQNLKLIKEEVDQI